MIFTPSIIADLLLLAIGGVMTLHALRLAGQHRWLVFDPLNTFWFYGISVYLMQPAIYNKPLLAWHSESVFVGTLTVILAGMIAVVIGYEQPAGVRAGTRLPAFPDRLNPVRFKWAASIMIALGLLGYAYLIASAGSLQAWLSVARGGTDYENINAWIGQLSYFLTLGIILLNFHVEIHPVSYGTRGAGWAAALLHLLFMLYLGSRSRVIASSLLMLAAYYLPRRRNPSLVLLAIMGVVLAVVVNFQLHYRDKFTDLSLNIAQIDMQEARERIAPNFMGGDATLKDSEYSAGGEFNCVMSTIELVPEIVPFNYGYGFLEIFTRPIPRAIWPDKRYPGLEAYQGVLRVKISRKP